MTPNAIRKLLPLHAREWWDAQTKETMQDYCDCCGDNVDAAVDAVCSRAYRTPQHYRVCMLTEVGWEMASESCVLMKRDDQLAAVTKKGEVLVL